LLGYGIRPLNDEFVFNKNFDENGALFYLGSYGKQAPYKNPH